MDALTPPPMPPSPAKLRLSAFKQSLDALEKRMTTLGTNLKKQKLDIYWTCYDEAGKARKARYELKTPLGEDVFRR